MRVGRISRPWTDADKARFAELWNAGVSDLAIRNTLKRSQAAIERMRMTLGLPARGGWVRRRGLKQRQAG
jgi:hypothetical protein